ncbi:MAG: hypothetical protein QG588_1144, partial [Candidatus Poribacteria bacterium]|nr:hypothetical protein [Candidatus Poribacteria bacterium]
NKKGFLESLLNVKSNVMQALAKRWSYSLCLAEDEEIMPGIKTFWLGCHSVCSQGIAVQTKHGIAVFTGDVVYKYRNIEENNPIGWADADECRNSMQLIQDVADIVIPSHDPELLRRFPDGIIGV